MTVDEAKLVEMIQSPVLDLQKLSQADFVTILLDLTLYQNKTLGQAAFRLLVRHFNPTDAVMKAVRQIQLLVDPHTIEVYSYIETRLEQLRRLGESCEVWLEMTNGNQVLLPLSALTFDNVHFDTEWQHDRFECSTTVSFFCSRCQRPRRLV